MCWCSARRPAFGTIRSQPASKQSNSSAQNDFSVVATEDANAFTPANLGQFEAVVFLNTTGDVLNGVTANRI